MKNKAHPALHWIFSFFFSANSILLLGNLFLSPSTRFCGSCQSHQPMLRLHGWMCDQNLQNLAVTVRIRPPPPEMVTSSPPNGEQAPRFTDMPHERAI